MQLIKQANTPIHWTLKVFLTIFAFALLHNHHLLIKTLSVHMQHLLEKETVLHFFLHDTPAGKNLNAIKVIQANGMTTNDTSQTPFGLSIIL